MSLNEHAKRVHNVAPDPVLLTFEDGDAYEFEIESAEFFQEDFQGEARRVDDDAAYRLVTDGDDLVVGRNAGDGWATFGVVTDVSRA
ncbi:transcriptional regulator [Salarchaeum japonicum]|uniref:transcriptional regulator n=1 Tax=Salarchaeum japonicum TaxID=555573 RepID=UPI003C792377